MGIAVLNGRDFTEFDRQESQSVAIVNRAAAERYFPGQNPLDQSVRLLGPKPRRIVGVVQNIRHRELASSPEPEIYIPHAQYPMGAMFVGIRTRSGDPGRIAAAARASIRSLDRDLPIASVKTFRELLDASLSRRRFTLTLLALFAATALGLSAVGIYGVLSYTVAQQTREIGIRMALGAARRDVLRLAVRQGMVPVMAGLTGGVVASFAATRALTDMLFEIRPHDAVTLATVAGLLLTVSLVATLIPARRAARVDPCRRCGTNRGTPMRRMRAFVLRLTGLFNGGGRDREIGEELASHLQLHIDDNIRAGMTPSEARRVAMITLGGIAQTTERYRDRRGLPALDALRQDMSYAVRVLRKNPAFTATAVLTLALGIGANSAIFSVVNAVLLRPLPFADPGRLVLIFSTAKNGNRYDVSTYPDYADWRNQNRSFSDMAAFTNRSMTHRHRRRVGSGRRQACHAPTFSTCSACSRRWGAHFAPKRIKPGSTRRRHPVSDRFWQAPVRRRSDRRSVKRFGSTKTRHTIVRRDAADVSDPTTGSASTCRCRSIPAGATASLRVVGRLRPASAWQQAQSDVSLIAERLARIYPKTNQGVSVNLMSLTSRTRRRSAVRFYLMLGVVAVVLVIACANVRRPHAGPRCDPPARAGRSFCPWRRARTTRSSAPDRKPADCRRRGLLGLLIANWTARVSPPCSPSSFRFRGSLKPARISPSSLFTIIVAAATGLLFGAFPAFASASPDLERCAARRLPFGDRRSRPRSAVVSSCSKRRWRSCSSREPDAAQDVSLASHHASGL